MPEPNRMLLAGLWATKGAIAAGRDADFVVWDPDGAQVVDGAAPAVQFVVAGPTGDDIGASAAVEVVGPVAAGELVVALLAVDGVVAGRAYQHVVTGSAYQDRGEVGLGGDGA